MTDFIIEVPEDSVSAGKPEPSVLMKSYDGKEAYLYTSDNPDAWPEGHVVVGAWGDGGAQDGQSIDSEGKVTGTPKFPLQEAYGQKIAKMRNSDNGDATGERDSLRWQGHSEKKLMDDGERYPLDNKPFVLRITRQFIESNPSGWGFKVEIISDDPNRDVKARRISVYDDEWKKLYSTGAFVMDQSTGLYTTTTPAGKRTETPDPIYFALTEGSVQEGRWQFDNPDDGAVVERLFWSD